MQKIFETPLYPYVMVWMPPWKGIIMCRGDVAVTSQK